MTCPSTTPCPAAQARTRVLPQVRCLNEAVEGSAAGVFRAWDQRLDDATPPLESNEDDPELLLHVPFDGSVKIKALCVIGAAPHTQRHAWWLAEIMAERHTTLHAPRPSVVYTRSGL